VEGSAPSKTKEETSRARDVGVPTTLGSFAHANQKKDLYYLHPVMCHDVERRLMVVNLDQLAH
jgi:hypothetical protein